MKAETELMKEETLALKEKIRDLEQFAVKKNMLLQKFLNQDQIASMGKQKVKEWSKETIIKSLKLRLNLGVHGYEFLCETGYPAPSLRTLTRKLEQYNVNLGVLHDLRELLTLKVKGFHPSDCNYSMSMDEMQIMESEDFDKAKKSFTGFVSLGNTADKEKLATHFFVILLRGIKTPWKQVIACASTSSSIKPEYARQLVWYGE